jgi:ElaB/YqjD/DUF883 family membrane-anchored ribosome-binding protein
MPANPSDKNDSDTSAAGLGSQISGATARVKDKAAELGQSAADTLDSQRSTAASGLSSAAETIHARADQLPGGDTVSGLAHSAADTLTSTADYVRQNDLQSMLADVEQVVKKNPGPSLLAAAFVGFLVGRAFTASD